MCANIIIVTALTLLCGENCPYYNPGFTRTSAGYRRFNMKGDKKDTRADTGTGWDGAQGGVRKENRNRGDKSQSMWYQTLGSKFR
jgi:hypothetical protein